MRTELDLEKEQKLFEEKVFLDFYIRSIKTTDDLMLNTAGVHHLPGDNMPFQSDFVAKNSDGVYFRPELNTMWHGWKLAAMYR